MSHHEQEFSLKSFFIPFTTAKAIHWLIFIGLLLYCNSLFNGFIGDDYGQLVNNTSVHSIRNIVQFFTNSTFSDNTYSSPSSNWLGGNYYRPLLSMVFALQYTLFGSWAPAYHFVQLALHISNSILLFFIIKNWLKKEIAFGIALLFLVHPINNESVVFISNTQEPLFLLFGLLAFWVTLQKRYNTSTFILTTILLLCSLLAKETGLLFLLIVPLFHILFQRRWKIGLLQSGVTLGIYVVLRFLVARIYINHDPAAVTLPFIAIPLAQKIENIPAIIFYYIKMFFYPVDLTMGQRWVVSHIHFTTFYLPLAVDTVFFLLIVFLGGHIYKRNKSYFTLFLFFAVWFVLGLCLHLQFIPLDATVASRWFYFPSIGLLGIFGIVLNAINFNKKRTVIIYFILLALITCLFGVRDVMRNANWKNELTLYHYEIQFAPNDYKLQLNYASALSNGGNQKEALAHISKSIELHPTAENWTLLGLMYAKSHKIKAAENALTTALTYDSNAYSSYVLLTEIMLAYDKPKPTSVFLKKFLAKYPKEPAVWLYLAIEEYKLGEKTEALVAAQKSLSLYPSQNAQNLYENMLNNKPVDIHFSF